MNLLGLQSDRFWSTFFGHKRLQWLQLLWSILRFVYHYWPIAMIIYHHRFRNPPKRCRKVLRKDWNRWYECDIVADVQDMSEKNTYHHMKHQKNATGQMVTEFSPTRRDQDQDQTSTFFGVRENDGNGHGYVISLGRSLEWCWHFFSGWSHKIQKILQLTLV